MVERVTLPAAAYDVMVEHARAAYPEECCGLLTGPPQNPGVLSGARACENRQNQYHRRFPEDYPRDARTAYFLDYRDLERVEEEAGTAGEKVRGIFHSHIDVGAYFSDEDKRVALMGGDEPAFADFVHIVLDAQANGVRGGKAFLWDVASRDFREVKLEIE